MVKSLRETYRRRQIQHKHNIKEGITPMKATSNIKDLSTVKTDEELQVAFTGTLPQTKRLKRMTKKEKEIILKDLKIQLDDAIKAWEFEKAAVIRDQIKEIDETPQKIS